jgi:hypothetical protein
MALVDGKTKGNHCIALFKGTFEKQFHSEV